MSKIKIIAIGSSTGGTEALATIISKLRPPLPPIVIVQHIPAGFSRMFAERMNQASELTVKEGEDGESLQENFVYVAPGSFHMKLQKTACGNLKLHCFKGIPVHSCRPSADILFQSVAELVGENSVGIILTGIGCDGAEGLLKMKQQGAVTLGQDKETSIVYGMPKVAFERGAVDRQIPLESMSLAIMSLVRNKNF